MCKAVRHLRCIYRYYTCYNTFLKKINKYIFTVLTSGIPTVTSVNWQYFSTGSGIWSQIAVSQSRYGGGTLNSPSLVIFNTATSDAGTYRCVASNSVTSTESQIISLSVTGSKYICMSCDLSCGLSVTGSKYVT